MKKIVHSDIVLGKPIEFSIYSEGGILLFRRGSVIHMPDQISRLLLRGAQYDEAEIDTRPRASNEPAPAHEDPPPFEHLNTLLLNLKHMLGTMLKSPEQIDISARIGKMAQAVQSICHKDIDSALAAPCLDTHTPYIVAHQMMGAVLTELIAQSKGLDAAQRLPLVCRRSDPRPRTNQAAARAGQASRATARGSACTDAPAPPARCRTA